MARKKQSRNRNTKKQKAPEIPAEQQNPDYTSRRLLGKLGEVTMFYIDMLERQYVDAMDALLELMVNPDFKVDAATLQQFMLIAPHLNGLPEHAERRERLMFIYSELSRGRIGYPGYTYEVAKAQGWHYSDANVLMWKDDWEKDFGG